MCVVCAQASHPGFPWLSVVEKTPDKTKRERSRAQTLGLQIKKLTAAARQEGQRQQGQQEQEEQEQQQRRP